MTQRAPSREVRSRVFDSGRWRAYQPRGDDIIIATYSKCGTTWMQRIVSMLIFRSAARVPLWVLSPWPDMRLFGPIEETLERAEAQGHRRFFKSHLPYDALPVHEGVKFIHVARDGRDAAMSMHNHLSNFTAETWAGLDEISLADPKFGDPYPRPENDPADYFHRWISDDVEDGQGDAGASFFHVENSYWAVRHNPDVLLVHYADLKRDREAEMRRVAQFLEIEIPETLWPELVEAAGFEAMKRAGDQLIPMAKDIWGDDGASRFFSKGRSRSWSDLRQADLDLYDDKVRRSFESELADWIENGRLGTQCGNGSVVA
jgi:aryl sulfotransferase